jgi:endonuclease G
MSKAKRSLINGFVYIIYGSLSLFTLVLSGNAFAQTIEIHSKHFLYGYPLGAPSDNDLIIRDLYALSSNDDTKIADWVCYFLTPHETIGILDLDRKWRNDPWLGENETLEGHPTNKDDYKGAHNSEGYDRGHLAPLASFKGSRFASQVNYYSNIAPQKKDLNQGPWMRLETKVRKLVNQALAVWVITGPLFERDMPPLPQSDETHKVPSGFWKIVALKDGDSLKTSAFIMDQDTARDSDILTHLVTIDNIESKTSLDFFWALPDNQENDLESKKFEDWAKSWVE